LQQNSAALPLFPQEGAREKVNLSTHPDTQWWFDRWYATCRRNPFFRKFDGWWYVQGRKRFLKKLVKGKRTKQETYTLFNQFMAEGTENLPPPTELRVSDHLCSETASVGLKPQFVPLTLLQEARP
jgi:hypothetical protein